MPAFNLGTAAPTPGPGTRTVIKTDVESDPAIGLGTSLGFLAHAYTTELRLKSVLDYLGFQLLIFNV